MTTIRVQKTREYFTIQNRLVTDLSLSSDGFRVLTYLLSKKDGWIVFNTDIQKTFQFTEYQLNKCLSNIKSAGYLIRDRKHTNGRWEWESIILEEPNTIPRISTDCISIPCISIPCISTDIINTKPNQILNISNSNINKDQKQVKFESLSTAIETTSISLPQKLEIQNEIQNIINQLSVFCNLPVVPKPWIILLAETIQLHNLLEPFLIFLETKKLSDFKLTTYFLKKEKDTSEVWKHFVNARKYKEKLQSGAINSIYNTSKPTLENLIQPTNNNDILF